MNTRNLRLLFVLFLATAAALPLKAKSTDDIPALIEKLKKVASPDMGIDAAEQKVANQLQAKGAAAVPYLIPLLKDKDKAVRTLAGYTLGDMKEVTEKDLDALIDACRNGDGWVPRAIGQIGTPKAVSFLVEELVREQQSETQVTGAIVELGEKAVPDLVEVYRHDQAWETDLSGAMRGVFKELGEKASGAVDPLMQIATDKSLPAKRRIPALDAVGAIGLPAKDAVPGLLALSKGDETADIKTAAEDAILGIGTEDAVPIYLERLYECEDQFGEILILGDIASLKERGVSAGPILMKYLRQDDWDVRDHTALTLGYIGYMDSADDLIKLLDTADDWQAVWCAAWSLGRMKIDRALPALERVSKQHWFPPVRKVAAMAIKEIRSGKIIENTDYGHNFAMEYFGFENEGESRYTEWKEQDLKHIDRMASEVVTSPIIVKQENHTLQINGTGVKVDGGYLLGYNEGEFGGGTGLYDSKGNNLQDLPIPNTQGIFKTDKGIFAVTGLAHLTFNRGCIYKLSKGEDGKWIAKAWLLLPGGPYRAWLLKNGNFLVDTVSGLTMVSQDGAIRIVNLAEVLRKTK